MHVLDVLLRLLHGETGLVPFLFADRQRCLVGSAVGLDVLLKLRLGALGFGECQQVLLRVDGAHKFVLADFKLRAAHRVFCLQHCGLVLCRLHGGIRLGFDDFLFGLQQVAAILSKIVFLLAGVKFEHYVTGANLRAGVGQRDDLQRASGDGRSDDGP